ncbi:MAG TPA: hypothetical protein VKS79_17355 [Gemmataceae bacterium]|nr:hypothetical protein [Gemmataceae bacterium]
MTKPNSTQRPNIRRQGEVHGGGAIPLLRVRKGASLKALYAAARRSFSAADLQKYTENEDSIPARLLLGEFERLDREEMKKRKSKARNGRSQ